MSATRLFGGFLWEVANFCWVTAAWLATVGTKTDLWPLHAYWYMRKTTSTPSADNLHNSMSPRPFSSKKKILLEQVWILFFPTALPLTAQGIDYANGKGSRFTLSASDCRFISYPVGTSELLPALPHHKSQPRVSSVEAQAAVTPKAKTEGLDRQGT